jgi:hypothetical protein
VNIRARLDHVIGTDESGVASNGEEVEISEQAKTEMQRESKMRRSMMYANDGMPGKALAVWGASPVLPSNEEQTAQLLMNVLSREQNCGFAF